MSSWEECGNVNDYMIDQAIGHIPSYYDIVNVYLDVAILG